MEAENERLKTEIAKLKEELLDFFQAAQQRHRQAAASASTAAAKRGKRRPGGQPGHARHTRPAFPPEQVDHIREYELPTVPAGWRPLDKFRVVQQVELIEKPYTVTEHRAPDCTKICAPAR